MTVVTNRTIPRDELRRRVAEAAIGAFRAHGYDAVTLERIAVEAQVAKGTFFNFFPTKAHVLLDYFGRLDARFAALRDALDPAAPEASLNAFFETVEVMLATEGDLAAALNREIWARPELAAVDAASGEADLRAYADFFRRAQAAGTVAAGVSPQDAAGAVCDLWSAAVRRWFAEGRRRSLADDLRGKLALLFAGLARA
jgi:AcrR family transcriptional regulator